MAPAGGEHSWISARVIEALTHTARATGAGVVLSSDCGFVLGRDPDVVRAPDAAFVRKERLPGGRPPKGFIEGAPDLAVEVVSPGDTAGEIEAKVAEYLDSGASVVWVVYPEQRRVWVHRSPVEAVVVREDGALTGDPVLPGLSIRVGDIL
jgi:Uma2 family endonuclease